MKRTFHDRHLVGRLATVVFLILSLAMSTGCLPFGYSLASGPYLTAVSSTQASISWIGSPRPAVAVQFWPTGSEEASLMTTAAVVNSWMRLNRAELANLTPFTSYTYRLATQRGDGFTYGPAFTFRTAPADPNQEFTFVAFGDTQDSAVFSMLASEIGPLNPAFWISPGDLMSHPSPESWGAFFEAAGPLIGHVSFRPAYGNHDSPSNDLRNYFGLPAGHRWYSFDYGSVHVVALDSNSDYSPSSPQYQWLVDDLASAMAIWKVVYFHHPPYCPTEGKYRLDVREYLSPLFEKYGVAVVFNGHSHVFDHYLVGGVHYVVTGGGGGWSLTHETSTYQAPFHYTLVAVSPDTLTVKCVRIGDEAAAQFTVTHP